MSNYKTGEMYMRVPKIIAVTDMSLLQDMEQEKRTFIGFYFSMAIQFEFTPGLFNGTVKKAYHSYLDSINAYREAVKRDDELRETAIQYGFSEKALERIHPTLAISLPNLGIVCSENPKDEKFILKTTRTFIQKGFPGIKSAMGKFQDSLRKSQMQNELLKTHPESPVRTLKAEDYLAAIAEVPELIISDSEAPPNTDAATKAQENIHAACMGVFLLGEESIPFLKTLYGVDVDITQHDFDEAARWFPIGFGNVYFCAEEYWKLLLDSVLLNKIADTDWEVAKEIIHTQLLQTFQNRKENEAILIDQCKEMAKQIEEMSKALLEAAESEHADAEIGEMQARISQLHEDYLMENRKVSGLTDQLEQYRSKLEQMTARVESAEKLLKVSQQNVQQLNNDLIDAYVDSNFFYDPEDAAESTPQVLSGLRQRLGEEKVAFLQSKSILVVGGHINTHTTLRELFPNWEFIKLDDVKAAQKGRVSGYDAICAMTSYCSHAIYDQAVNMAKSAQILLVLCPKNSAYGVCEKILQYDF